MAEYVFKLCILCHLLLSFPEENLCFGVIVSFFCAQSSALLPDLGATCGSADAISQFTLRCGCGDAHLQ